MDLALLGKIAVVVAAALLLWWRVATARRRQLQARAHMLDGFLPVLRGARLGHSPWRYRNIEGWLDGRAARFDLLPDTLVTRSLPTLWLRARWVRPHQGWLCVTMERNGAEYFGDDCDLGTRLQPPARWPGNTEVRGRGGESLALLHRLEDLDLSAYHTLKQFVLTGIEVKLTIRVARGDRAIYRVTRSADFSADAVTPALLEETLAVLRALDKNLTADEEAA